jgi:transcriptional regulator with XRE-family HTH domain
MRLDAKVKALRQKRGLTQAALARKMHVTAPYISMIESGARAAPSLPMLKKLAKALGVSVTELLA